MPTNCQWISSACNWVLRRKRHSDCSRCCTAGSNSLVGFYLVAKPVFIAEGRRRTVIRLHVLALPQQLLQEVGEGHAAAPTQCRRRQCQHIAQRVQAGAAQGVHGGGELTATGSGAVGAAAPPAAAVRPWRCRWWQKTAARPPWVWAPGRSARCSRGCRCRWPPPPTGHPARGTDSGSRRFPVAGNPSARCTGWE